MGGKTAAERAKICETDGNKEQSSCWCCSIDNRKCRRNCLVFLLLFAWIMLGMGTFHLIEHPQELAQLAEEQGRQDFIQKIIADIYKLNHNSTLERARALAAMLQTSNDSQQRSLVKVGNTTITIEIPIEFLVQSNVSILTKICARQTTVPKWDLSGALFFVITVITTIGYGNYAPSTNSGRVLCIFYAIVGVPLMAMSIERMQKLLIHISNRVRQGGDSLIRRYRRHQDSFDDRLKYAGAKAEKLAKHFKVRSIVNILIIAGIGTSAFLFLPALLFDEVEDWDYLTSLYYGYITLSTIGFGDLVGGQTQSGSLRSLYRLFLCVWIFFGIAFISTIQMMIGRVILDRVNRFVCWTTVCCARRKANKDKPKRKPLPQTESAAPLNDEFLMTAAPTESVPEASDYDNYQISVQL